MAARLELAHPTSTLRVLVTGEGELLVAHEGWRDQALEISREELEWLVWAAPALLAEMPAEGVI